MRLVFYVDQLTKTAAVYTKLDESQIVPLDSTLIGDSVLPSFSLALKDVLDVD